MLAKMDGHNPEIKDRSFTKRAAGRHVSGTITDAHQKESESVTGTTVEDVVCRNLHDLKRQIADICQQSERDVNQIRLVAVTKYAQWEWVEALATHHLVFGENRPQQLAERQPQIPQAEWHLIGQLQRNKVRLALQHAAMIHSVDSIKLLRKIAEVASELQLVPSTLLQINVSGEDSKSGFQPDELLQHWNDIAELRKQVKVCGLMTMAPADSDPEAARPTFRGLRQFRDQLIQHPASQTAELQLPELSMGMSGDFAVAIEEGATMIRIGSRLFEGLD